MSAPTPGERLPNIIGTDQDGQPFMLYDFSCGAPGAIWVPQEAPSPDEFAELVGRLPESVRILVVLGQPTALPQDPRVRAMIDDGSLASRLLGDGERVSWITFDEHLRVLDRASEEPQEWMESWPLSDSGSDSDAPVVSSVAPVLMIPRVFDAHHCRRLIDWHLSAEAVDSPAYGSVAGGPELMVDAQLMIRRDTVLEDPAITQELSQLLSQRLLPEVAFAFAYNVQAFERIKVVSYDAQQGGHFALHRDNLTPDTRHRVFALTICLNDDYEGGDLIFPEFGPQRYRPPAGGALVFSGSLGHAVTPVTSGCRYALISFLFRDPPQQPGPPQN